MLYMGMGRTVLEVFFDPELALWPELRREPLQFICSLGHSCLSTVDRFSHYKPAYDMLTEILHSERQRLQSAAYAQCPVCVQKVWFPVSTCAPVGVVYALASTRIAASTLLKSTVGSRDR